MELSGLKITSGRSCIGMAGKHRDSTSLKVSITANLAALCIVSGFISYFMLKSEVAMEFSFLALLVPTYLCVIFNLADFKVALKIYCKAIPYLIFIVLSFIFNLDSVGRIFHNAVVLMNIFCAFFMAAVLGSKVNYDLPQEIMRRLFFMSLPLFIYAIISQQHSYIWGRWAPFNVQHNWWGIMALGLAWFSFSWNKLWIRAIGLTVALYFMLAVQSRGALIAFLPALLFSSGWFYPLSKKTVLRFFGISIFGILLLAVWEISSDSSPMVRIANFIVNDVMLVNDEYRGLSSGMSGRLVGYERAWGDFLSSPLLGNGFGEYSYVHNGFLLTMVESGLFALLGMIYLLFSSFNAARKVRKWKNAGYIASYILALATYPRSFNINMTAFVLIVVMMSSFSAFHDKITRT